MKIELLYDLKKELAHLYLTGLDLYDMLPFTKICNELDKNVDEDPIYMMLISALYDFRDPILSNKVDILERITTSLNYLLRANQTTFEDNNEKTEQIPVYSIDEIDTHYTYLELSPIIRALSHSGKKDHLEVIKEARGKGYYQDIRLYPYLNKALNDSDISDEVEDIIGEETGPKILPFILPYFEINNEKSNLHRLSLLFKLKYSEINELVNEVLASNSTALQTKLMEFMIRDLHYEDMIIGLCDSPQKPIREIAYLGLAKLKTKKAEEQLCALYAKAIKRKNKYDIDLFAKCLSQGELTHSFDYFFSLVKDSFDTLLRAGKKADSDMLNSLRVGIVMLKQKGRPEVYDFLSSIPLSKEYNETIKKKENALAKQAKEISYAIIDILREQKKEQLLAFYEKVIAEMPDSSWKSPFFRDYMVYGVENWDATQVYNTFSPYYLNGSITIEDLASLYAIGQTPTDTTKAAPTLDERWIDGFYATMEHLDEEANIEMLLETLHTIEPTPSDRFNQSLLLAGQHTKKYLLEITSMIIKRDLPDKYETVYSLIKQCHDRKDGATSNLLRQLPRATYWEEFPKEYAAKFKELKNAPRAIFTKIESN